MKLSRLYSNKNTIFGPIDFAPGLNVILAEIRLPENKNKDTHNLGKTTLASLLDFCLLKGTDPEFFLFKHADRFGEIVFFLEIELLDHSFITVRRSVREATKICIKRHQRRSSDFSDLAEDSWDHSMVGFEKARELLDGALDLRDLSPWSYRKVVGYLLRSQVDFQEVFHLKKFASKHADWKPFLAHLLGFNSSSIERHYAMEDQLKKLRADEAILEHELGGSILDVSKIEGLLLLKQKSADKKMRLLDEFDFHVADKDKTKLVVEELDGRLARLNQDRYSLSQSKKRILQALEEDEILFDPKKAAELFREAGIIFQGQVRKDFEQLIAFNRAITDERRGYLKEELKEVESELKTVSSEILGLEKRRSETLAFLSSTDVFTKFKRASDELVTLRADITSLERQRQYLKRLQDLRASLRELSENLTHLQSQIEADVEQKNSDRESRFSAIRIFFSEIVEDVIGRKGLLSAAPNSYGHLEFKAEILDDSSNPTSADSGFTYRKLLCVAFDLALARSHLNGCYPRFVFHDGVFESLDDRKKLNLMDVIRSYCGLGVQHLITLIDSDMPSERTSERPFIQDSEIVVRLHDEGESGRLFKMPTW